VDGTSKLPPIRFFSSAVGLKSIISVTDGWKKSLGVGWEEVATRSKSQEEDDGAPRKGRHSSRRVAGHLFKSEKWRTG